MKVVVFEVEVLADHVLLRMRNVLVTPHAAFDTREAVQRILETTVEDIREFARSAPRHLVAGGHDAHVS